MMNTNMNEEEELLRVMQMVAGTVLPMVMKTAIELDFFEIMVKLTNHDHCGQFTSSDIVSCLPTQTPQTPIITERILRYLATKSILTSKFFTDENGVTKKLYAMTPICKYFVSNEEGGSFANFFLFQNDKVVTDSWHHLKDAVLEGGTPFNKAHGENIFEYQAKDKRFGVEKLVDVGGGLGATLGIILSKYPNIKGINFDMPHVIKDAPLICPGVEHVGGDMFQSVPKGDVIFMKWILHDWGDDYCMKLLKNCWMALPEDGKVVVLETIVPDEQPTNNNGETDVVMSNLDGDMVMLAINPGGKERTVKEYEALAIESGFVSSKIVCSVSFYSIMEFYKKI
ncbi:unnamed protein product [Lactuca saligna]|uniref:Uncharacterized protein n=1 Tax=Lactuca saligna TaxID=75948 RepID=A0AA36EPE7_LACSI|nr:unnamed protein product [Lactuca saligna]